MPDLATLSSDALNALFGRNILDPEYGRVAESIASGQQRPVNIFSLTDPQKAWLAAGLARTSGKRACILVADELRARSLATDLKALYDQPVLIFRPRELNLSDAEAVSREIEMQRLAVLARWWSGESVVLVVTAAACLQKIMPRDFLDHQSVYLKVGSQADVDELGSRLTRLGYERVRLVEGPGQFASRGDILDIVPAAAEDGQDPAGIRISFFDIEIDAIKTFDLETQRSGQMLKAAAIPPARDIHVNPEDTAELAREVMAAGKTGLESLLQGGASHEYADHIRQVCRHDAERIGSELHFASLDRWLPLIYKDAESVLDYLGRENTLLFVDEPLRFRNRLDAAQAEWDEHVKNMLEKAQILPLTSQCSFRGVDIMARLDRFGQIVAMGQIASSGNGYPGGITLQMSSRPADSYRGREDILVKDCRDFLAGGGQPALFCGSESRQQRLRSLLLEAGVNIPVIQAGLPRGFVWPAAGLMVIGTQDIFGSERPVRHKHQAGIRIDLFSDLVPGEWIVHEAHGIGRYEGLANLESKGAKRDYLKIAYAGGDVLYIPMESLDQIQKYVGAEGREPHLSKLGGQEWTRLKERARESIRRLATDLVRLYAERQAVKGHPFSPDTVWQQEFEENFPFEETDDQIRTISEIKQDMESEKVMDRLLCGDVGYGKTEVAFRAIFKCVMDGLQAMFLAPTTVLAQQHYDNLINRISGFPVNIGLMSRFASEAEQKETLRELAQGKIDVVIGTHRLLSRDVRPKNLGLLVVDEEQRFGVDHKEHIKALSPAIDVLTLTATPIPRTLHMAMSGIRDISVLEEPPHDRRPVQTYVMEYDQDIVTEAILREISRHGQIFYLYNDTRRIVDKATSLEKLLPGARIAVAHGKMAEASLEEVVGAFISQQYDILVCTTIIESGIDMPNVNTIIVEEADRLGLAQLYQLRGRVGRSDRQAFAYVTYRREKVLSEAAEKRLTAIRDFTELGSGFKIALRDLEVRGAGNLLGAEQHGHLEAIGYDLYCRMLEEEVRELQGHPVVKKTASTIDLDVDAYLSKSYIPDEGQRMDMYRKVAAIACLADYQDVLDEWQDRFGQPPEAAVTLADIAYSRASAERHGFNRISQQHDNLLLNYDAEVQPDMETLARLLNWPGYKGLLLFNAGKKPYLLYRGAARERRAMAESLRKLFQVIEPKEVKRS